MDPSIKDKFESYPSEVRTRLIHIRKIIFEVAEEEALGEVTEELKWGEPSYTTKIGSPIRVDWKPKNPNRISIFVNCKTVLIETYKEVYSNKLQYVGNREIVLPLSEPLPLSELRGCIVMALKYHRLKKLTLLGAHGGGT